MLYFFFKKEFVLKWPINWTISDLEDIDRISSNSTYKILDSWRCFVILFGLSYYFVQIDESSYLTYKAVLKFQI